MKRFIAIISIAIISFSEYSYSFNFNEITNKLASKTLVTGIGAIKMMDLSDEAISTINLIKKGGPFPYPSKDGTIFKNIEGRLPPQYRGYYKEYTVPTPNAVNRGARRIVTGQNGEMYYTEDHYQTFMEISQ